MSSLSPQDPVAKELTAAVTAFRKAVDALKRVDATAAEKAAEAATAAKDAKRRLTDKELEAARRHEEVHAIKEEAYDVFTQLAGLEVRAREPLDPGKSGGG